MTIPFAFTSPSTLIVVRSVFALFVLPARGHGSNSARGCAFVDDNMIFIITRVEIQLRSLNDSGNFKIWQSSFSIAQEFGSPKIVHIGSCIYLSTNPKCVFAKFPHYTHCISHTAAHPWSTSHNLHSSLFPPPSHFKKGTIFTPMTAFYLKSAKTKLTHCHGLPVHPQTKYVNGNANNTPNMHSLL